jgi:hypothetical protein
MVFGAFISLVSIIDDFFSFSALLLGGARDGSLEIQAKVFVVS